MGTSLPGHRAASQWLIAALLLPSALVAAGSGVQINFGDSYFASDRSGPAKDFPPLESLLAVPRIVDPLAPDPVPVSCEVEVMRNAARVNRARGRFEAELFIVDSATRMVEVFPIDKGKFRTDSSGQASFDFDLPTELVPDGFESGDVSAWIYTRTHFTRKRADTATLNCTGIGVNDGS